MKLGIEAAGVAEVEIELAGRAEMEHELANHTGPAIGTARGSHHAGHSSKQAEGPSFGSSLACSKLPMDCLAVR